MKLFQASLLALVVALCTCEPNATGICMVGLEREFYSVVEGMPLEVCVVYVSGNCSEAIDLRIRMINPGAPSKNHFVP